MPEMTGVELAKEILTLRPGTPLILCTGFGHLVDADKAKAAGIKAFAMKPLTKREIAKSIRKPVRTFSPACAPSQACRFPVSLFQRIDLQRF
jgi:FixJ family two-component response regulator